MRTAAAWALPSIGLALAPKCPACVAGYVALLTGTGISLPTATLLRSTLLATCTAALAALILHATLRTLRHAKPRLR